MTKVVSICLIFCLLTAQLWWRPNSVRTDDIVADSQSQVDDSAEQQALPCDDSNQHSGSNVPCEAVDGESDSETGTPEDKPLNPILTCAVMADKSGRLTRPLSISRVLALSNAGQTINRQRDPRGDHAERVATAARCRTSSLLALARATRPHAPPLA